MILGAQRLGHGVILQDDPLAIEYAKRKNIAIETNLTSNLRLLVIPNIKANPFLRYMRLGINVSLSTDDEGMFGSSIDGECEVVVREYDTSYSELKKMSYNSIEASFFSDALKKAMKSKLDKQFKAFESKH
jgi:adenosine deaminase